MGLGIRVSRRQPLACLQAGPAGACPPAWPALGASSWQREFPGASFWERAPRREFRGVSSRSKFLGVSSWSEFLGAPVSRREFPERVPGSASFRREFLPYCFIFIRGGGDFPLESPIMFLSSHFSSVCLGHFLTSSPAWRCSRALVLHWRFC